MSVGVPLSWVDRVGRERSVVLGWDGPEDRHTSYTVRGIEVLREELGVEPCRYDRGVEVEAVPGAVAAAGDYLARVRAAGVALDAAERRAAAWPLRWWRARAAAVRERARVAYKGAADAAAVDYGAAAGSFPHAVRAAVWTREAALRRAETERWETRQRAVGSADAAVWQLAVRDRHAYVRRVDVPVAAGLPDAGWSGPLRAYPLALELAGLVHRRMLVPPEVDGLTWDPAALDRTREQLAEGGVDLEEWWDAHAGSAERAVAGIRDPRRRGGYGSGSFI